MLVRRHHPSPSPSITIIAIITIAACLSENILFNNAYLHYITSLVADISTVLGLGDKAQRYAAAADKLAAAVTAEFADEDTGVYLDTLQTHSAMPLAAGLVPESLESKTMGHLANAITVTDRGHLDTGMV